jgi:hypothetical protein
MEPVLFVGGGDFTRHLFRSIVTSAGLGFASTPTVTVAHAARWAAAPLVLIDVAEAAAAMDLPGRDDGLVVFFESTTNGDAAFDAAERLGAPYAVHIPGGLGWLVGHVRLHRAVQANMIA